MRIFAKFVLIGFIVWWLFKKKRKEEPKKGGKEAKGITTSTHNKWRWNICWSHQVTSALVWNFKGDFRIYKGKSAWHIKRKAKINLRSLNFHVCSGYKLNVKAEKSGLVSSLGGSPGPFQVTGRGGTFGWGVTTAEEPKGSIHDGGWCAQVHSEAMHS